MFFIWTRTFKCVFYILFVFFFCYQYFFILCLKKTFFTLTFLVHSSVYTKLVEPWPGSKSAVSMNHFVLSSMPVINFELDSQLIPGNSWLFPTFCCGCPYEEEYIKKIVFHLSERTFVFWSVKSPMEERVKC